MIYLDFNEVTFKIVKTSNDIIAGNGTARFIIEFKFLEKGFFLKVLPFLMQNLFVLKQGIANIVNKLNRLTPTVSKYI